MLAGRPLFKQGGVNKLPITATRKDEPIYHVLFVDFKEKEPYF